MSWSFSGLSGPDVQEAVLGKLVQRYEPLAVRFLGLPHGAVVVAGLIMHIDFLDDRIDLLALISAFGELDVPLADLAVEEERGIGVAPAVIGGMERTKTQLGLGDHYIAGLDLVVEQVVELARVENRHGWRQLAVRPRNECHPAPY